MVDEKLMQDVYDLLNVYHDPYRVDQMSPATAQMEYYALLARGLKMPPKNPYVLSFKHLSYVGDSDDEEMHRLGQKKCHVVYYFYGANNSVLYVGRTDCFQSRWMTHLGGDKQMHMVQKVEIKLFENKLETIFYEGQEIIALQPWWNIAGLDGKASKQHIYPIATCWFDCKVPKK